MKKSKTMIKTMLLRMRCYIALILIPKVIRVEFLSFLCEKLNEVDLS